MMADLLELNFPFRLLDQFYNKQVSEKALPLSDSRIYYHLV